MALNLWKVGGLATSFSPLPTGTGASNRLNINPNTDYKVSFKAKSPSSTRLRITGGSNVYQTINLTAVLTYYEIVFTSKEQLFYLFDIDAKGDIQITDIELVQKPLGAPKRVIKPSKRTLKAKTGLAFDGVKDYLQLPSMTMDSIEIECLIDAVQSNGNPVVVDARPNLANGYFSKGGNVGTGWNTLTVDGVSKPSKSWNDIPLGQRTKIKLQTSAFTGGICIFSNNSPTNPTKGTLYKVTPCLNGAIVAQYDFENPKNIVGNQVIQNAQNLIPGFDDARWNLHANAKVFGKDVLRLDATGGVQDSPIILPIDSNQSYLLTMQTNSKVWVDELNIDKTVVVGNYRSFPYTFTARSSTKYLKIVPTSTISGTFDFIKPSLYQLTGKEATLYGGPIPQQKPAKRQLFTKR